MLCYCPLYGPWKAISLIRTCLDQLLIAISSFTLLCDHSRSKTRLIAIVNLIAKLGMIYATACHASLYTTALDCLSVSCHCHRTALTTIYKHGTGRGRWGLVRQLQQQLALWVSSPPTGRPTDRTGGSRPSTLVSHCQHYLASLTNCATPGGAFDHD